MNTKITLIVIAVLTIAELASRADSVKIGHGVKYHTLQPAGTNGPVTMCWRRGEFTTSTNAVDCKQCIQANQRNSVKK